MFNRKNVLKRITKLNKQLQEFSGKRILQTSIYNGLKLHQLLQWNSHSKLICTLYLKNTKI